MIDAVLDASVVLKWFHSAGEEHVAPARALRRQFEAGELRVIAPPLLWLEIVNVAARRWGWDDRRLGELATALAGLGFELIEPDIATVARWAARGLTAYDAAYIAVAEETGARLISDDAELVHAAPERATALGKMS